MTVPSPKTDAELFESNGAVQWISPKYLRLENVLRMAPEGGAAGRVFIVDRDSMGSDLLAGALVRDSGFAAAVIQASDLLDALSASDVDLVVIGGEVSHKSGKGFDLAQEVARAYPNVAIVMLLNHPTQASVVNAFRSGARGVFSRQQTMAEFLDCVAHVGKGFIWAGQRETEFLLSAFRNIPSPNMMTAGDAPSLTAREMQVVQCAATGKTNKTIAADLGLSEHTVKNYLFRAFEKLGVSSRIELLFYLTTRGQIFNGANGKPVVQEDSAGELPEAEAGSA